MPEETEEELDIILPVELATYLSQVYRSTEDEALRVQAAVGLSAFWGGSELNRITQMLEGISFGPVPVPGGSNLL